MKTNKKQQGNLASDERTFKLKNLAPNEPYLFKLAAVTSAGISEESEISFDLSKGIAMKFYIFTHSVIDNL